MKKKIFIPLVVFLIGTCLAGLIVYKTNLLQKENKLTKKEKERLHMWVDAGHSAYDLQWLYQLREEEEFDELLSGLTDAQVNYVYSYCMNWDPIMEEPFFDYNRLDELDLDNLPTFEEEVDKEEEEPEIDLPF